MFLRVFVEEKKSGKPLLTFLMSGKLTSKLIVQSSPFLKSNCELRQHLQCAAIKKRDGICSHQNIKTETRQKRYKLL
jgi:hypothetical protein